MHQALLAPCERCHLCGDKLITVEESPFCPSCRSVAKYKQHNDYDADDDSPCIPIEFSWKATVILLTDIILPPSLDLAVKLHSNPIFNCDLGKYAIRKINPILLLRAINITAAYSFIALQLSQAVVGIQLPYPENLSDLLILCSYENDTSSSMRRLIKILEFYLSFEPQTEQDREIKQDIGVLLAIHKDAEQYIKNNNLGN